jgi:hypothetical protein
MAIWNIRLLVIVEFSVILMFTNALIDHTHSLSNVVLGVIGQ